MCDSLPIARALAFIEGSFVISWASFLWHPLSAPITLTQLLQVGLTTYTVSRLLNLVFLAPFPSSLSSPAQTALLPARTPHTFLFFPIILLSLLS